MEMFYFGIFAGMILTIILLMLFGIKGGKLTDDGDNDNVSDVRDGDRSGSDDERDNKPPHRSKETVIFYLGEMGDILGLCRTEKETLEDAIYYLEEGE